MKLHRPRRSYETSGLKRFMFVVFIFMVCAGVLGLFWLLSQLGPRNVDYRSSHVPVEVIVDAKELREQSIELEAQFEERLAMHAAEAQDILLLKRALDLQSQYVKSLSEYDFEASQRLENLVKRYQDLSADQLRASSVKLENEALALVNNQAYEAAWNKYQQAFEIQKTINENFPLSSAYNVARATHLQRQTRYFSAEPLFQRSLELERQADALIDKNEWAPATEFLKQAIAIQQRLNREYRGTNQSSVSRLEGLQVKLVGIKSGQNYFKIKQMSDLADANYEEGAILQAASIYQTVARLQKQLNDEYPDSSYASSERVSEFQRKSQTAESFELGQEIEKNHDLLTRLLSERRVNKVAEVIVALRRDIQHMEEVFPLSSLNDNELQLKARYLDLVQNDLGHIQDHVYSDLLRVPEERDLRMFRTEVPQSLYTLVMGTNPSRHVGDANPVDSVSWVEAKSFCERLSWILGREVRLPTENEFRQALGRLRYVVLENHVWSVSDADGVAQPVGQKAPFASGFYDLLGNVSEWLESINLFESEDAQHMGGHVQDRVEKIFTVPIRSAPRGERSRLIGFRIVVVD